MNQEFSLSQFIAKFSTDDFCLEEIKRLRYPKGVFCKTCERVTKYYRLANRPAYTCKFCRTQIAPLVGTIFEKSSTPLRVWFLAIYVMTYTRATISIKQLQRELGVTYKTAWRIYTTVRSLMAQNNGDLLEIPGENNLLKWTFFNRFEIKVVEKKEMTE